MYLYSGKVVCIDCGRIFRGKKQHNNKVYICEGYHNKKTDCPRFAIKENDLLDLIDKHYRYVYRYEFEQAKFKKKYGEYNSSKYLDRVEVGGKEKRYEIFYIDNSKSTVNVMGNEAYFRL